MSVQIEVQRYNQILNADPALRYKDVKYLQHHIQKWKYGAERKRMMLGNRYYVGEQDILRRFRTVIGTGGEVVRVDNLPNNRIVDNQYVKMVDQKVNYLLSRPLTFDGDNEAYIEELDRVFNKQFHRTIKNIGKDSYNCGIGWLYVYLDENGEFKFKRFDPVNVIPFWKDDEHTELEFIIRMYDTTVWVDSTEKVITKVEVYHGQGIDFYTELTGSLIFEKSTPYLNFQLGSGKMQPATWNHFPVIPFKGNGEEIPLIMRCKCLQDAINTIVSDFQNAMQEDGGNTILILENFEGENLAEFRHNLATYRAVKVCSGTMDGGKGDVRSLQIEVNAENYKTLLDIFKRALIENCKGIDVKDEKLGGNPNQMNIQCMYFDIDQDANEIETEYQCSFEQLLWFMNCYRNMGRVFAGLDEVENNDVEIIFNRDVMMNETEAITNCVQSVGIISDETILSQHPWVKDVAFELDRLEEKKQKEMEQYAQESMIDGQMHGHNSGDDFE